MHISTITAVARQPGSGDATAPVTCKVYKNDKIEAPLGPLTLAPGTEQEVTAAF